MSSNADLEQRWIDAWNDLYDLASSQTNVRCLLPDGSQVTMEECKGWLQDSAYEGYHLNVETGWVGYKRGILVHRWKTDP